MRTMSLGKHDPYNNVPVDLRQNLLSEDVALEPHLKSVIGLKWLRVVLFPPTSKSLATFHFMGYGAPLR